MSPTTHAPPTADATVLDHLVQHLRSRDTCVDGQERPAAILWTDPKAEWRPITQLLLTRVEELLVLGDYAPEQRTGPAIWVRCVVDRTLDHPALPAGRVPIVYLPGVARQDLRAGESCREDLRPLVELMFRGTLWLQHNGHNWGAMTFLTSPKGLGLDVARDQQSAEALLRALPEVAITSVGALGTHRLEADDFDRLLSEDVVRDVLRWMGDPAATRARLNTNAWAAFCSRCRQELDLDPGLDADVTAGERLGLHQGPWDKVWQRFREAPATYPGIEQLLRRSQPTTVMLFDREPWPAFNDEEETAVRQALKDLPGLRHEAACDTVIELEKRHGHRRAWVWGRLGKAPMANVLAPLSQLATAARTAIGGVTPDDIAQAYREHGWQGDAAAWEAIAAAPMSDEAVVRAAVRHLLHLWLDESARAFQAAVNRSPLPGRTQQPAVAAPENGCLVFADGLRYDLGQRLVERIEGRGCKVTLRDRWAALPTVTATGKPAVTPVADDIKGHTLEQDFGVHLGTGDKPATAANLRKAIADRGYQILGMGELDVPLSASARGWLQCGDIDSLGHNIGGRLVCQIDAELDRLTEQILGLLQVGWESVRVVTDHGWLLLPGGLPKVDLPKHLTESRWARCAVIAGASTPDVSRYPWHWNAGQTFATAPGIACFNKSDEYAHGGLSIQECLTPDILVERPADTGVRTTIHSIAWRGLRCIVDVTAGPGIVADLRLDRPAGQSVAAAVKPVEDNAVSLVLADDTYEAAQLVVVLLDEAGNIQAHRPTRVGEDK